MEIEENQPSPPVVASDNPIEVNESNSNNGSTANTSRYSELDSYHVLKMKKKLKNRLQSARERFPAWL